MNDTIAGTPVIVMSCYNGSQFVAEQIESIQAQSTSNWRLLIRDDGSSDATSSILNEFAARDPRIEVVHGANIGVIASFFTLLTRANPNAAFVVLADQDDVWRPTKLAVHAETLSAFGDEPALTYSALRLVDREGVPLPRQYSAVPAPRFNEMLVQNRVPGCTIAINSAARRLLVEHLPIQTHVLMHDWWIMLAVSAFGQIISCPQALVDYRQHGANVIGIKTGFVGQVHRLRRVLKARGGFPLLEQAEEFLRVFNNRLSPNQRSAIRCLLKAGWGHVGHRLLGSIDRSFYRTKAGDDVALRLLLASGHYRSGRAAPIDR